MKWREPRGYVVARDRAEASKARWWSSLVGVLAVSGLMMLLWSLARSVPGRTPPRFEIALILAVLLGIFLFYLLPPLLRLCPSEVKLNRRGVTVFRGSAQMAAAWSRVQSFEIRPGGGYELLCFRMINGEVLELALDPGVPRDQLEGFLSDRLG
ncbi:MAG: hypothetical protein ACR2RV_01230 [Verrucomicrobiales bacterium]